MQYSSSILFVFVVGLFLSLNVVTSSNINPTQNDKNLKSEGISKMGSIMNSLKELNLVSIEFTKAKKDEVAVKRVSQSGAVADDDDNDEDDDYDNERYYHKKGGNCKINLYRFWNGRWGDHFYTPIKKEINPRFNYGYSAEGIVGVCLNHHHDFNWYDKRKTHTHCGSVPLYRYYNDWYVDHFYTTSANEIGTIIPGRMGNYGYISEGIACFCFTDESNATGLKPLHRYYNPNTVDHFYTMNEKEINTTQVGAVGNYGYIYEGIQCWMWPAK